MSHPASLLPRTSAPGTSLSRTSLLPLALMLACAGSARADTFQTGQFITYPQALWGGSPFTNPGATLVAADFGKVYASSFGVLTIGLPNTGFTITFDAASSVLDYLPAPGTPAALNQNYVDPTTSTSSGGFGGDVLALQLNVDFNDAGFLVGTSGLHFGDLVLQNLATTPALNGLTVREFLADANTALGGGAPVYDVATLDTLTAELNVAFGAGNVSTFAQTNLTRPTSAVPEPSSLLLLLSVVAVLGSGYRFKRDSS